MSDWGEFVVRQDWFPIVLFILAGVLGWLIGMAWPGIPNREREYKRGYADGEYEGWHSGYRKGKRQGFLRGVHLTAEVARAARRMRESGELELPEEMTQKLNEIRPEGAMRADLKTEVEGHL